MCEGLRGESREKELYQLYKEATTNQGTCKQQVPWLGMSDEAQSRKALNAKPNTRS